jgi:alkylation response protein AidB-like acyl-CoA dehydrogenase
MGSLDDERFVTTIPYQSRFRPQFDDLLKHLASTGSVDSRTRDRITQYWIELRIIEMTNDRLLADALAGRPIGARSSIAKLQWATWHRDFAAEALDIVGMDAIAGDRFTHVADIFLNARAETIYGGANEIQKNVVAERVLDLPR